MCLLAVLGSQGVVVKQNNHHQAFSVQWIVTSRPLDLYNQKLIKMVEVKYSFQELLTIRLSPYEQMI